MFTTVLAVAVVSLLAIALHALFRPNPAPGAGAAVGILLPAALMFLTAAIGQP